LVPEVCGTLSDGAHNGGGLNGQDAYTGRILPIVFANTAGDTNLGMSKEGVPPLTRRNGDPGNVLFPGMRVRRLTPRECERLQGFPDDYTLIPYRGKPAADGPRYKALGNSHGGAGDAVDWRAHPARPGSAARGLNRTLGMAGEVSTGENMNIDARCGCGATLKLIPATGSAYSSGYGVEAREAQEREATAEAFKLWTQTHASCGMRQRQPEGYEFKLTGGEPMVFPVRPVETVTTDTIGNVS
jgi:hypothetical protein